ncbi:unnamed protein product [Fusarium graminearum]|uniref:Chromosome 3, complete genome n=1 Tax=Gibberella zeae (strain ATCC MYA-4620 / CBS 123657 / FGSC 9075 / NRRL 31084 / PH-1) TaxID=229533 RepID=A0A1C3YKU2_GIBZE|nr:unnamed protein product [Fusarium graminearum]
MSGKLAEDFAVFRIAEEGQVARLQALSCQIQELVGKYDDAVRDLESERVARRFTQQDADESRAKYEELQQSMERSSFVLVLIDADADSYIFKDEYYAASEGGTKASLDLRDRVRSFLQANRPDLSDYPIIIKAYANEAGLSHFLVSSGMIKAPRDLVEFAKDFTQASEYTDFLLVGSGKDRADKKIQDGGCFQSRALAGRGIIARVISIRSKFFDLGVHGRVRGGCKFSKVPSEEFSTVELRWMPSR